MKFLMLVRQKRNLEQDLKLIKHRSYRKKRKISKQRFHEHYGQERHNGIDDWQFTLIEQFETHEWLKQRETFRQHRYKTFYSHRLDEKKDYLYHVIFPDIPFTRHTIFLTILTFTFVFISCLIFFLLFTKFWIQFSASYFFHFNFLMVWGMIL